MPQPKKDDPTTPNPGTEEDTRPQVPQGAKVAAENNEAVNDLLKLAQVLEDEKVDVYERIGANRELLRNYLRLGMASADQYRSVLAFYPPPKARTAKDTAAAQATPAAA